MEFQLLKVYKQQYILGWMLRLYLHPAPSGSIQLLLVSNGSALALFSLTHSPSLSFTLSLAV